MGRGTKDIDFVDVMDMLWRGRRIVLFATAMGLVLALLVLFLTPREYTAHCEFIQQSTSSSFSPRMMSLASLAGINLSSKDDTELLSASLYSNIVHSVPFMLRLLNEPLEFLSLGRRLTIVEYVVAADKRDSGLRGWFRTIFASDESLCEYHTLSSDEYRAMEYLKRRVVVEQDVADGFIVVEVTLPDAVAAAELADRVVKQLEEFIIDMKLKRVRDNMHFIEERYAEARSRFDSLQMVRAAYMDSNQHSSKHSARTMLDRIDAEYELAEGIYGELAMQLEQTRIKVREQTPVLAVFSPTTIPFKPSKPRKMIIFITFATSGFLIGATVVWARRVVAELHRSRFRCRRRSERNRRSIKNDSN